ncbi:hypothetical protein ADUPG1_000944, partial [Aduncisulcus paluster]
IVNAAHGICSLLEQCTEYIHTANEYRRAVLCCVLRVCELSEWRESVREIERSVAEVDKIDVSMKRMKSEIKGKKIKVAAIDHEIEMLRQKLSDLIANADSCEESESESFDDSESDDDSLSEDYKKENVDDLKIKIQRLVLNSEKITKKINSIRSKMNKRFHRCVELQQHATHLSNVGFVIPTRLNVSNILDHDLSTIPSSPSVSSSDFSSLPFLFNAGVSLEMFSNIQDLCGISITGATSLGLGPSRNQGNIFTALWQKHVGLDIGILQEKVVLKYIHFGPNSTSYSSSLPSSLSANYRTLLRSALAPRMSGSCPYIIPLQCIFHDEHVHNPSRKGAYLVFPYYPQGDMFSWVRNTRPDLSSVIHVFICVLSAIAHLHSQSIVHCDLKPTNILIDPSGNGILCDFEGSIDCSERTMRLLSQTMYVGTPGYIAPELSEAIKEHSRPHPTPASDMYSFGKLLKDVIDMLSDVSDIS